MTETYPAFILSEGKVNRVFIGKSCSKLDINNYQSNSVFFFFDQWLHIRKDEYRKCHLSNTHFAVGWKREKK